MKSKSISTIVRACALAALFVVGTQSNAFATDRPVYDNWNVCLSVLTH